MRAGQNVMELVEQYFLVGLTNVIRRILHAAQHRQRAQNLRLAQGEFQHPVHLFDIGLGGEGAAVHFQVEFAVPRGQFCVALQIPMQEFGAAHDFCLGHD